ncbi:hypothetical protein GQ55_7G037400 [Panicum hallii var. hallii]|uniref:Uncharacterized protein n=1 Tax=Panicum hallii var. hallii TaxID=1504633 RepID=A0A2T7CSI4_9POAL|nr:hypothetical protein GQ55_7G037400 [Panicum hallii var. hallii]
MVARHGEEYDWRTSDVDVGALYSSGGGKKHGRFSMLNGVIDTSGALSEARCSQSTQNSGSYQRQSQRETVMQEKIRQHEEAMQRQEEWARQQHEYMQAATLGSQFNLPPLPSPPPPPPNFVPFVRVPSPQVGSTSTHPREVSASPSTPPSAPGNISGGDCGSGHSNTPPH